MTTLSLAMRFKGTRDYVHGTDIVDTLHRALASELHDTPIRRVDCRFHRLARTNLDVQVLSDEDQPPQGVEPPVAVSSCEVHGRRYRCLIRENGSPVTQRVAFDEDEIVSACRLSPQERTIELRQALPYTRIETYSAINKALVSACFPDASGKWLAVRVGMHEYIERAEYTSIVVSLTPASSPRLTESAIVVDGIEAARIYFSLAPAEMTESSAARAV